MTSPAGFPVTNEEERAPLWQAERVYRVGACGSRLTFRFLSPYRVEKLDGIGKVLHGLR